MNKDVCTVITVDGIESIADMSARTFERIAANLAPEGTPKAITAVRIAGLKDLRNIELWRYCNVGTL